jgi:hypothetical protein
MSKALEQYLNRVMIYANRSDADAPKIRAELEDHLLKKVVELEKKGIAREDAIFQAIEEHGTPKTVGYGLRSKFPWLDIRSHGTARGFIAIGPKAVGVFAWGGMAIGIVAVGGFGVGLLTMSGFGLGLLFAFSGFAFAPFGIAYGGFAIGAVAAGGVAVGVVASGGTAFGMWVPGAAKVISFYRSTNVPEFMRVFDPVLKSMRVYSAISIVSTIFMLMTRAVSFFLQRREVERIRSADPKLLEA